MNNEQREILSKLATLYNENHETRLKLEVLLQTVEASRAVLQFNEEKIEELMKRLVT